MVHGLELVPFGVAHERGIVAGAEVRSKTWPPLVSTARCHGGGVELVNRFRGGRIESQVEPCSGRCRIDAFKDVELLPGTKRSIPDAIGTGPQPHIAERSQHRIIERCGSFEVYHAKRDVADHH